MFKKHISEAGKHQLSGKDAKTLKRDILKQCEARGLPVSPGNSAGGCAAVKHLGLHPRTAAARAAWQMPPCAHTQNPHTKPN